MIAPALVAAAGNAHAAPMTQQWDATAYAGRFGYVSTMAADLVGVLDPQAGERVVDLGCGTGALAAQIAASGAEVLGIDADEAMIVAAREQQPTLRFEVASGYDFDLDALGFGPADAVFSNAALHWMTRPEAVLERVALALRPGGRFVAEMGGIGNTAAVSGALRAALERHGQPREAQAQPWYFPSPATYAALLERHGFEVRALWLFDRMTPLADGEAGLRGWLTMFAMPFFGHLDVDERAVIVAEIEDEVRDRLYIGGVWHVDYRRLRFSAVRLGSDER